MFQLPTQGNGHSRIQPVASPREKTPRESDSTPRQALSVASNVAKTAVDKVGKCIADHPGISLGAAVTCGVIIGWLIKRTS